MFVVVWFSMSSRAEFLREVIFVSCWADETQAICDYTDSVIDGLAAMLRNREELPCFSVVLAECISEPVALEPVIVMPEAAREAVVLRRFFSLSQFGNAAQVRKHYLKYN